MRELATELAFSLALVLVAEGVSRLLGWDRFWALAAVFTLGHGVRAWLTRRRRLALARAEQVPSPAR